MVDTKKVLTLEVNGVAQAIKHIQALEDEIRQLREDMKKLQDEADKAGKSLSSIDKGVKFANFKAAMKSISGELVNIATTAATSGKSASENITDIGKSIAGIASNFGPWGAAVGAAITLLTPLISKLFELSAAEAILEKSSADLESAVIKNTATLDSYYSVLKSGNASREEERSAIEGLVKAYPDYFEGLDKEKVSKEKILSVEADLRASSEANLKLKAKEAIRFELIKKKLETEAKLAKETGNSWSDLGVNVLNSVIAYNTFGFVQNAVRTDAEVLKDELTELNNEIERTALVSIDAASRLGQFTIEIFGLETATRAINKFNKENAIPKGKGDGQFKKGEVFTYAGIFGDTFDTVAEELNAGLDKVNISVKTAETAIDTLKRLQRDEIERLGKDNDEIRKAIEEGKKIQSELEKLNKERQKIEEQQRVTAEAQSKKTLTSLAGIASGTLPFEGRAESLQFIKDLYKQVEAGTLSVADAQKQLSEKGLNIGGLTAYTEAAKKTAAELDRIDKDRSKLNKKLVELDAAAQKSKNSEAIAFKLKTDKQIFDAEQKLSKRRVELSNLAIRQALQSSAEADREKYERGLSDFETYLQLLADEYKISQINLIESERANLDQIERINTAYEEAGGQKVFAINRANGEIITNEFALNSALNSAQKDQIQTALELVEAFQKKQQTQESDYNKAREAAARDFTERLGVVVKEQNEDLFEQLKTDTEKRVKQEQEDYDEQFELYKSETEKRRKEGKKQGDAELAARKDFFRRSQQNLEQSLQDQLSIELFYLNKTIDALKLRSENTTDPAAQAEILAEIERLEKAKLAIVEKYNKEYAKISKQRRADEESVTDELPLDDKKIKEKIIAIGKELQAFSNSLVDLFNQNSQNIIDGLNEQLDSVEQRTADALSRIAALEDDLEGKRSGRREAVLQALEQQREIERQAAEEKIALQNKIAEEERKQNKRNQAAQISNAIINGALAITNIWGQWAANPVIAGILTGISAATTGVQIATIASQKFAEGGFTGDGSYKDETGHKVAGIVHNDEWVAPKWMVESPKFGGVINQLENARRKGFAQGGFTSPDYNGLSNAVNPNNTANMERIMQRYMSATMELANRPIYTKATEVATVAQRNNNRRVATTI